MSPFIFILVAEVLSSLIRQDEGIQGIKHGQTEVNLTQFADDTTCMLANETSLKNLLLTLERFESWSGLKINKRKTQIISPARLRDGCDPLLGMPVTDRAKVLGLWLGMDPASGGI